MPEDCRTTETCISVGYNKLLSLILNIYTITVNVLIWYLYSKTNQTHNISSLFYFDNNTLHVSDGFSVHHQESKTVHTTSVICHIGSVAAC